MIWRATLPSSVDMYDLARDPGETTTIAQRPLQQVEAAQRRLNALAAEAAKPLFLIDQFKVVQRNMQREPMLPTDECFGDPDVG